MPINRVISARYVYVKSVITQLKTALNELSPITKKMLERFDSKLHLYLTVAFANLRTTGNFHQDRPHAYTNIHQSREYLQNKVSVSTEKNFASNKTADESKAV